MRGRGKKAKPIVAQTRIDGEVTETRERVERTWFGRIERDDSFARMVTAEGAHVEPFHRWLVFKQAYSPALVRLFLDKIGSDSVSGAPLLDPFSGTGTFVTECARRSRRAIGVETLMSTAFVTRQKFSTELPPAPDVSDCETWQAIAERLEAAIHRAALICAVAGQTTARGTINKNAAPIARAMSDALESIRDDLIRPLPIANGVLRGDARTLDCVADESVGGICTSPPYLSRHDYAKLTQPYEEVFAFWSKKTAPNQLPASARANPTSRRKTIPAAAEEAVRTLHMIGERRLGRVTESYFADMIACLKSFHRVMRPGSKCWIVIGGARIKDVYIPTDTILADVAGELGFVVERVIVARKLVANARKFGRLTNVAPRESILMLRRT